MTRFLLVSGIVLVLVGLLAAIFGGATFLLNRYEFGADPYPPFMRDYEHSSHSTYQEAERIFSEFVVKTFPIGSNAVDAIAQASGGGFRRIASASDALTLLWKRRAGPCYEDYYIIIDQNAHGTIARATGRLHPVCL